jgi:subtilisin family serine protease
VARPRRVDPRDPVVVGRLVPQGPDPVAAPDAWAVLQSVRSRAEKLGLRPDLAGLALNHLFQAGSHVAGHPVVGMSHVAGHPVSEADGLAEYVMAGSGGRAPVAWVGEPPAYQVEGWKGRRPVVAVLDTGCGTHPWFETGVTTHAEWQGTSAEVADAATDPERTGDVVGPLDGQLDTHSGHGTFIAGLIRQICPKADIWALRVMSSDGIVEEHDLIRALGVLNGLVADALAAGEAPPIDIVSLSLGYYHELPSDQDFDPVLLQQLQALGRAGVAVVACAGNDATTREMYPAAFLPHDNGVVNVLDRDCVPVVSVGALNPDGSIALFSNGGAWVAAWDVGAALVSTFPTTFDGGSQPTISMPTSLGRPRATIDPDRYAGGFGTWSGTSFSTPVLAGRLAQALLSERSAEAEDQLSRIWPAVTEETGIARPDA